MPINPHNPFKGREVPGEVIVLCVRWYLRYPLSYDHVTELVAERGVEVDASCVKDLPCSLRRNSNYGLRAAARMDLRSHAPRNTRPPESFAS